MFPPSLDTRSLSPGQWLSELPLESVIDIKGTLVEASVKSCTQSNVELQLERCYCVSRAANVLPFLLEDAARPEEEVDASQDTERPFPRIGQEQRLDNRWLDLRVPANNAIMRVQSGVCTLFREVRAHARALRPAARRARESERARRAQALLERQTSQEALLEAEEAEMEAAAEAELEAMVEVADEIAVEAERTLKRQASIGVSVAAAKARAAANGEEEAMVAP